MKQQLFSWIDNAASLAVELQTELTKRPAVSPESGGEGEMDKCVFFESWLKAQGIAQLERYDAPDSRAKGGVRPNLIATIGSGEDSSGCLWILSHLDVVPPGEISLWKTDPWTAVEVSDGPLGRRLIGRGVEDNQQGLVSSVLAALAFVKSGLQPRRTVKLLFAADEEMGSAFGISWLLENHGELFQKNDIALVPDGGDTKGESIEVAEKNLLWARFVTKGAQAHGSRPDLGINAHLAGADLALRLHYRPSEKSNERDSLFDPDYSTFQPTKKEANVPNINTIPGEDVFCMDMRILPRYPVKAVLAEIDCIKGEVAAKHKVAIDCTIAQSSESPATAADAPLVQSLSAAIGEVYGVKSRPVGIGGGTIAAHLRRIGIDSAVWSRLGDCAHQPNEFSLLENMLGDAKVMALLMAG
ncbi:MAG: M20 family metallo-hydrolase [Treponema sp.]|jgi:succinyl-diaminopimelate desuccinylase|nr:M20 family metallo-hydrolase [Treponema sp.]